MWERTGAGIRLRSTQSHVRTGQKPVLCGQAWGHQGCTEGTSRYCFLHRAVPPVEEAMGMTVSLRNHQPHTSNTSVEDSLPLPTCLR